MEPVKLSDHFTYGRLIRFTLPSIIMMLATSIYSIVDGFFVSNYVGKTAFAAVNLIMPVIMAVAAVGFMIGTGGSALVAKTLGEGKKDKANEIFSMLIAVLVITGVFFTIVCYIFMPQIAKCLGASEDMMADCVLYGRILILADVFFMLQNSYQSFLVTAQRAGFGLAITLVAGVLNMLLDYLLVYVFPFGIAGAALATTLSQIAGGMIPTIYFLRKNSSLLQLVKPVFDWSALFKACTNGSSELLTNLSTSLVSILYNFQLMKFAGENGVAAYGVIMYVNFIFMAFFFGYAVGCNPVVGYHFGAGNKAELRNVMNKSLGITAVVSFTMAVLALILSLPLSKLFVGYDEELLHMTTIAMRLYSISFLICGYNIFASAYFTGLNNGLASAVISFLRTFVFQLAAIFILPIFYQIEGIWLAVTAAEGLTLIVTVSLLIWQRKRNHE